jgi:hypothetical protein
VWSDAVVLSRPAGENVTCSHCVTLVRRVPSSCSPFQRLAVPTEAPEVPRGGLLGDQDVSDHRFELLRGGAPERLPAVVDAEEVLIGHDHVDVFDPDLHPVRVAKVVELDVALAVDAGEVGRLLSGRSAAADAHQDLARQGTVSLRIVRNGRQPLEEDPQRCEGARLARRMNDVPVCVDLPNGSGGGADQQVTFEDAGAVDVEAAPHQARLVRKSDPGIEHRRAIGGDPDDLSGLTVPREDFTRGEAADRVAHGGDLELVGQTVQLGKDRPGAVRRDELQVVGLPFRVVHRHDHLVRRWVVVDADRLVEPDGDRRKREPPLVRGCRVRQSDLKHGACAYRQKLSASHE